LNSESLRGKRSKRELREELGCGLTNVPLRTILENRFTMFGTAVHEVVFVFTGSLECTDLDQHKQFPILDVPGLQAIWWSPATHHTRLVPDGLISHLPRAADAA
jgi:8-oxo-dGTP pyrophosphatase MutT (NUDIX family)